MKKSLSLIRIATLFVLGSVAFALLFCEEQDENIAAFAAHVIADKGIAAALVYYVCKLYGQWFTCDDNPSKS